MISTEQAFTVLTKGLSAGCGNSYETSRCITCIFKLTFTQVTNSNLNVEGNSQHKLVHLACITKYETRFTRANLNSELDSHYYASSDTYSTTYLLTPWSRVLLEKLTGLQLVKKFPAFYRTRRFITALTSPSHLSLSWASSITVSRGSISHMCFATKVFFLTEKSC